MWRQKLSQWGYKVRQFFIGRNGQDHFGVFLIFLSIFTGLINHWVFTILAWIILVYALFRIFSKNLVQRRKENIAFLRIWQKVRTPFQKWKIRYNERKFYRIFKCPTCKQKLRVPKYKGTVKVKCTKCGEVFIRKT